jgi:hypothetical protein
MNITWNIRTFDELTTDSLYMVLQLRQEVFVLEQDCAYLDCDGKDQDAFHPVGHGEQKRAKKAGGLSTDLSPGLIGGLPSSWTDSVPPKMARCRYWEGISREGTRPLQQEVSRKTNTDFSPTISDRILYRTWFSCINSTL